MPPESPPGYAGEIVLAFASHSHTGRVREGNEDAFIADAGLALFAVADGLGGHQGGEVASKTAVETILEFVTRSGQDSTITWPYGFQPDISFEANQLRNAVMLANRQIRRRSDADPDLAGMGSTVTVARVAEQRVAFVSVGDSRLYRWRTGVLTQLSDDDTWIAAMVRAGAETDPVRRQQMRHMLTKALGPAADLAVRAHDIPIEAGDLLVLCSDGLYGPIGDDGIARVLAAKINPGLISRPAGHAGNQSGVDLGDAAAALVDAANAAGGPDNITVVLVRYGD